MKRSHVLKKLNEAIGLLESIRDEYLKHHEWRQSEPYGASSLVYEITCLYELVDRINCVPLSRHQMMKEQS